MIFNISETVKIYLIGLLIYIVGGLLGSKQLALYAALFYSFHRLNELKIKEIKTLIGWGENRGSL
ncbi:hypothetical protein AVENLUH5627_03297 [Acinetobacter venetianus]|uniref:Uncharacterized protein n=1 Tax=Acinetobacter venetianus TaxID=52133 RepID=A0A150HJR4_9GAMM|nr:hypothetical protein AVENLUH5627_03297 [Acinetobacter venetianus]